MARPPRIEMAGGRYHVTAPGMSGGRSFAMDYNAVGAAMSRFGRRLAKDCQLKRPTDRLGAKLSNMEM